MRHEQETLDRKRNCFFTCENQIVQRIQVSSSLPATLSVLMNGCFSRVPTKNGVCVCSFRVDEKWTSHVTHENGFLDRVDTSTFSSKWTSSATLCFSHFTLLLFGQSLSCLTKKNVTAWSTRSLSFNDKQVEQLTRLINSKRIKYGRFSSDRRDSRMKKRRGRLNVT